MAVIRDFTPEDLEAVTRIYARHVLHGTATFEEVAPREQEMWQRSGQTATMDTLPGEIEPPQSLAVLDRLPCNRPRIAFPVTA
jgi:hypothetical protein